MAEYSLTEILEQNKDIIIIHLMSFIVFFGLKYLWPNRFGDWIKRLHVSFGIFPFAALFTYYLLAVILPELGILNLRKIEELITFSLLFFLGQFCLFLFGFIGLHSAFLPSYRLLLVLIYIFGTLVAVYLTINTNLTF